MKPASVQFGDVYKVQYECMNPKAENVPNTRFMLSGVVQEVFQSRNLAAILYHDDYGRNQDRYLVANGRKGKHLDRLERANDAVSSRMKKAAEGSRLHRLLLTEAKIRTRFALGLLPKLLPTPIRKLLGIKPTETIVIQYHNSPCTADGALQPPLWTNYPEVLYKLQADKRQDDKKVPEPAL